MVPKLRCVFFPSMSLFGCIVFVVSSLKEDASREMTYIRSFRSQLRIIYRAVFSVVLLLLCASVCLLVLTRSTTSRPQVIVEESKTLGPNGWDKAQFLLEANEGQTKGTVDAVASSGEKSRLLLLLETLLPPPQQQQWTDRRLHPNENKLDGDLFQGDYTNDHLAKTAAMLNLSGEERAVGNPRTGISTGGDVREVLGEGYVAAEGRRVAPCAVLYDEIDAHVGGRTAVAVGRLLANQGRDSQV